MEMHPPFLRAKARELRVDEALTIDELASRLAVPRTTAYYWVRDLPIAGSGPGGAWPEAARRKGTRSMQRKYRLLRDAAYEDGRRSFPILALDPTFRDFVCLYVAEGYKRRRGTVSVCNSDPAVMRLSTRWIRRLATNPVGFGLQYHRDQDLAALTAFWSAELSLEPAAIRVQRKSNSNQLAGRSWRSRHGVLAVWSNDTLLRARVEAWMDCLREDWT
jgi:hypothetical protein